MLIHRYNDCGHWSFAELADKSTCWLSAKSIVLASGQLARVSYMQWANLAIRQTSNRTYIHIYRVTSTPDRNRWQL